MKETNLDVQWLHHEKVGKFQLSLGYKPTAESVFKDGRVLEWYIRIESMNEDVVAELQVMNENAAYNAYNDLKTVLKS